MAIVCFDTQVIIWGVKEDSAAEQKNMIEKAKALLTKCDEKKHEIIIPSLVIAELLMNIKPEDHPSFLSLMHKRFKVIPFDARAASHFARMWRNWAESKKMQTDNTDEKRFSRDRIKIDYMITATAMSVGAECIYSEDPGLKKFASEYIRVESLPAVIIQPDLLESSS